MSERVDRCPLRHSMGVFDSMLHGVAPLTLPGRQPIPGDRRGLNTTDGVASVAGRAWRYWVRFEPCRTAIGGAIH